MVQYHIHWTVFYSEKLVHHHPNVKTSLLLFLSSTISLLGEYFPVWFNLFLCILSLCSLFLSLDQWIRQELLWNVSLFVSDNDVPLQHSISLDMTINVNYSHIKLWLHSSSFFNRYCIENIHINLSSYMWELHVLGLPLNPPSIYILIRLLWIQW